MDQRIAISVVMSLFSVGGLCHAQEPVFPSFIRLNPDAINPFELNQELAEEQFADECREAAELYDQVKLRWDSLEFGEIALRWHDFQFDDIKANISHLIVNFRQTPGARQAEMLLNSSGLRVFPDGQIYPKGTFFSVVAVLR